MNKAELTSIVAINACLSNAQAARAIDAITHAITKSLQQGQKVTLPGFAVFSATQRKAHNATNPRTKQPIAIPARTVPCAKFSPKLRDSL